MKLSLSLIIALLSSVVAAQQQKSPPVRLPFEFKIYTGGPNLAKAAYRLSSGFQDKITYSGKGLVGFQGTYKFERWISAGFDATYRYSQLDFDINDSTFYLELQEKWGVDLSGYPDPFGHYTLKVPRFRGTLRANFHFLRDDKPADFYFGMAVGINRVFSRLYLDGEEIRLYRSIGTIALPVAFRFCFGYTYHFLPNLGINTEFAIGGPLFSIGLTGRF